MPLDLRNPNPLYQQIVSDIRSRIAAGSYKENDCIGSHQELAKRYDVSLITVKRALNELINEGLLYSRVGKGTFVAGRSPFVIHSKHKTIGIVLNDLKSPFFSLIVHSFEERAYQLGYNILLSTSSDRLEKEEIQIRRFRDLGVDGLLIASLARRYRATPSIRKLQQENFPYVMVSYVEDEDVNYVGADHERGAFMATEHLIKLGYDTIGYINGEAGNLLGDLRKRGYLRALQHYNLEANDDFVFLLRAGGGEEDFRSGYEIGKSVIERNKRPRAMFVYNDLAALGFQQALLENGLRVPEDIAIVGFDNIKRGPIAVVPLTTIAQPTDQIGALAFDKLSMMIQGQSVASRSILAPKLIVRRSCGGQAVQKQTFETNKVA